MLSNFFRLHSNNAICKLLQEVKSGPNDPYHLLGISKEKFLILSLEEIMNNSHLLEEGVCRLETLKTRTFYPFREIYLKYLDDGSLKIEFKGDDTNEKAIRQLCSNLTLILGNGQAVSGFTPITNVIWLQNSLQSVLQTWDFNESTQLIFHFSKTRPRFILMLIHFRTTSKMQMI